MLTKIREKLKGWVIGVLLLLVAIPLVFMGLGNYQTTSNSYPLVIDEQSISAAKIEQEVFQYSQALEKNFQGNIPPFYTNSFIKNLTINYMTRAILLDNNSRNIGLVFHNESIVDEIMNTSAFKDETGFNNNLYRRQLLAIGMDQQTYERYIYQKGITEQLQNSITETSFLTKEEKINLIQFRYHKRIGSYLILPYLDVKKTIKRLERLYKSGKYSHKRIWQVGMILYVRLKVLYKNKNMKKEEYNLAKKYFKFLGKRTKIKKETKEKTEIERKKLKFVI